MLASKVRRPSIVLFVLLVLCGGLDGAERPNVVLFLVDDMGWMDSSAYGSKYYETPNMERLAKQSMRFTDAYALPLCSPCRASILTGQYSSRHGITSASGHRPPAKPGVHAAWTWPCWTSGCPTPMASACSGNGPKAANCRSRSS